MTVRGSRPYLLVLLLAFLVYADASSQDLDSLAKGPPFSLTGSVGLSLVGYNASGIEERREPFSWTVNGGLNVSTYEINIPIDFILSEQERGFRQTFNRIGLSPSFRSITTHIGYRTMSLSQYSLNNVEFLGAGAEISPGSFRLKGMYGRFQRSVEEDTTRAFVLPAYERWGYAAQIGYESDAGEIALNWFKAWDDSNSLDRAPVEADVRPQENTVASLTGGIAIVPNHLRLEAEGAASVLTRDIRSEPTDTTDIPGIANDIQTVRNSTTFTLATNLGLEYSSDQFDARLGYERIEPDFESLGTYYFTTDVERFTLEPNARLMEGELQLGGSIGLERDNLLDTRLAQTNRLIGSAQVGWNPNQTFGIDASYLNYSTTQGDGREPINDSIAARSVSQSASLSPRLLLTSETMNHFVTVVGNFQDYTDLNAFTGGLSDSRSLTGNLIYNLSFVQTPVSTGATLLTSQTTTGDVTTNSVGGTVNASVGLFNSALSLGGSIGYTRTTQDLGQSNTSADVFNENVNASWRISPHDLVSFNLYATQSSGDLSVNSTFDELTAVLSYSRSFSIIVDEEDEESASDSAPR